MSRSPWDTARHIPLDAIESLAATLVDTQGLTTMLTTLTPAPADLTLRPHLSAPPVPVAFTLGARDVRTIGLAHARRPPVAIRPRQLGTAADPALHYPFGDGTDPDAWTHLTTLMAHLRPRSSPPPESTA
nr:DUF6177 family protein [Streptomyces macrolidinus]